MRPKGQERVDVAVAGAGIAGLATALALATGMQPAPRVLVCDPALASPRPKTLRALAIAPAARRFLHRIGAWERIEAGTQPITGMALGDTEPGAVPPPVFLHFEPDAPDEPLAHMVLQDDLHAALLDLCSARGVHLRAVAVTDFSLQPDGLALAGAGLITRLLVAADGAGSRIRERAGIRTVGWGYGQAAIVATLDHTEDHRGIASQVFLPGGPLAFLPLRAPDGSGRRTSIVWSETAAEAERLLALRPERFCAALEDRAGRERGRLTLVDTPRSQPLALRLARDLVAPRLALVGDAARRIHPLAGQGLNLGLADAEMLAQAAGEALALGLDPGASRVLNGYARARRIDGVAMAVATDGLNRLFSNAQGPLRLVRDLGLGLVERSPALKRRLVRRASGLGS